MNWNIGDRAILVNDGSCESDCLQYIGSECVIVAVCEGEFHDWDVDCGGQLLEVKNSGLRPIPDEYDGNEASSWDECPWQPKELVMI